LFRGWVAIIAIGWITRGGKAGWALNVGSGSRVGYGGTWILFCAKNRFIQVTNTGLVQGFQKFSGRAG